jgi:predicted nucleotidyltransferase
MDVRKIAEEHRIFYTRAGSHAYGLATETSDEDFRGIFIGLPDNLVGLHPVEHCELSGDNMLFELRKFLTLAKECNPNIIELLFVDGLWSLWTARKWKQWKRILRTAC